MKPRSITATMRLFFLLLLSFPATVSALPEMPAIMLLVGNIAPGTALHSTAPRGNDQVLAFSVADGMLLGSGPVSSSGRDYIAVLARAASFNGSPVVLELMQGRARYQLLIDGQTAWLPFRGRTFPERTLMNLRVGVKTADLLAEDAANPQAQRLSKRPDVPCDSGGDVNGDGKCDEADWAVLMLFGGGVARSVAHP